MTPASPASPASPAPAVPGGAAAFAIRDLRWTVGADFTLAIPSLDLPAGETTLLLGPSASGKSTLLALLGRVEGGYFPADPPRPLAGSIHLAVPASASAPTPGSTPTATPTPTPTAPLDLLALSERELLRRKVRGRLLGFVFQREGLFPGLSALDNVAWPLRGLGWAPGAADVRAEAVLAQVGLPPDRAVATLSGGERKRLALARALAPDPPVLLLDEPLTGLDPRALGTLLDLLAAIAAEPGRTVVLVTHQREDIDRLGTHVVLMRRGAVAAAGPRAAMADVLAAFVAGLAFEGAPA